MAMKNTPFSLMTVPAVNLRSGIFQPAMFDYQKCKSHYISFHHRFLVKSPFLLVKSQFLLVKSQFLLSTSPFCWLNHHFFLSTSPFLLVKSQFLFFNDVPLLHYFPPERPGRCLRIPCSKESGQSRDLHRFRHGQGTAKGLAF